MRTRNFTLAIFAAFAICLTAQAQWNPSGSSYTAGSVGIGTAATTTKLRISTNAFPAIEVLGNTAAVQTPDVSIARSSATSDVAKAPSIQFSVTDASSTNHNLIQGSPAGLQFFNIYGNQGWWVERMRLTGAGYLGIGTTNPASVLSIKGEYGLNIEPNLGDNPHFYVSSNSGNNIIGVNVKTKHGTWERPEPAKPSSFVDFSTYSVNNPYYGGIAFFTRPVNAEGIGTEKMVILNDGKVGIGTTNPRGKFDIDGVGDIYLSDDLSGGTTQSLYLPGHIFIAPHGGSNISYLQARRADNSGTTELRIRTYNAGALTDAMHIQGNGNIGIGTLTTGSFKLAVEGKIGAREINVLTGPWPDYVFEKNYNLPTLTELEAYINVNKHLPEVPSACAVEENGINLGEMNMLLLKKVEELTLYVIEQNKMIVEEREIIKKQNERITKLELAK